MWRREKSYKVKSPDEKKIPKYTGTKKLAWVVPKLPTDHEVGLKLDGLVYDDRSQAVILNKGMPIISKVNNEDIGIFNNQRFKIKKMVHLELLLKMILKSYMK